jgi:transposase
MAGRAVMIQLTPQMKILVAVEAVDGRKGIDSLARLCQEKLAADPFSGYVFMFRSRRATGIRLRWPGILVRAEAAFKSLSLTTGAGLAIVQFSAG